MFQKSKISPLKATYDISTVFLKQTDNYTSCQAKILIVQNRNIMCRLSMIMNIAIECNVLNYVLMNITLSCYN